MYGLYPHPEFSQEPLGKNEALIITAVILVIAVIDVLLYLFLN